MLLGRQFQHPATILQVTSTMTFLKRDQRDGQPGAGICYPACTLLYNGKACNKKLQGSGEGDFFCERCQASAPHEWRYLMQATITDHSGFQYVTCFQVRIAMLPFYAPCQ